VRLQIAATLLETNLRTHRVYALRSGAVRIPGGATQIRRD
jgi:hypothetical protein